MTGTFITFEGGEGAGKTTQADRLRARLIADPVKRQVIQVHEPGGTDVGEFIHTYLRNHRATAAPQGSAELQPASDFPTQLEPEAELFLFLAARAQLVHEVIRPQLHKGTIVISDRFADSTTAYQGYGRNLSVEHVQQVNRITTQDLRPSLTILLDIDPTVGLARLSRDLDYIERESADFHRRVREGYLKLAAAEPDRFMVLDGERSSDELEQTIWERVSALLPNTA